MKTNLSKFIIWQILVLVAGVTSDKASAQSVITLNKTLPLMQVVYCATIDQAKLQANKYWEAGRMPFDSNKMRPINGCGLGLAMVNPIAIENSIRPYNTWTEKLDINGQFTAKVSINGRLTDIRAGPALQQVKFYRATLKMRNGDTYDDALVQIPDYPYAVEYAGLQKTPK